MCENLMLISTPSTIGLNSINCIEIPTVQI